MLTPPPVLQPFVQPIVRFDAAISAGAGRRKNPGAKTAAGRDLGGTVAAYEAIGAQATVLAASATTLANLIRAMR